MRSRRVVEKRLADFGMKLSGCTIELYNRAEEIQEWLDRHPEVDKFVILDDESISGKFPKNLVQTTIAYGLLPTHVRKAIKILNS